jgi:choline dehydrogenase
MPEATHKGERAMKKKETRIRSAAALETAISRRTFTRGLLAAGLAAVAQPLLRGDNASTEFDYIVVGAGAGGGPVAARLAAAGYTVAVLDAGLDPLGPTANSIDPRTGIIYLVPALAAVAAEDPLLSWDFYVKHYSDPVKQASDSKYVPGKGIIYPRGSALGGSTAHNAMVFVYPHDKDWDDIAESTGDDSWRARQMRQYFERLERCDYCEPNAPGHGFNGYMSNNMFDRQIFELYPELKNLAEAHQTLPSSFFHGNTTLDVNHPLVAKGDSGAFHTPMHVAQQRRVSIREHLITTQSAHPDKLFLITGALATKVLMQGRRAAGVEFVQGAGLPNLYEADKLYNPSFRPTTHRIYAKREVILSAGVFNTPQLLMLSGIGPATALAAHGIDVVANVPGVGANLQDRYEITVNVDLNTDVELYTRCTGLQPGDPCLTAWFTGQWQGQLRAPFFGPYANNALYASRIAKSHLGRQLPDLFIVGQATAFDGFVPGFSQMTLGKSWTWLILKAHTNNTAGTVKLRSTNPREMPEINFHYFEEGNDASGEDLRAVVEGIRLARSFVNDPQAHQYVAAETHPGNLYQTDAEVTDYVRKEAWGHHASCTAKIGGDDDRMAVLDSRFRVRGVKRLRVVDICAFPRIPGFFPVVPIFMIGEKAADAILHDANRDDDDD